jgi:Protein of unknown function (DUF3102)
MAKKKRAISSPNGPPQATTQAAPDLARSNSLCDLAARIKVEHSAVSESLRESVRHSIAAGELLIEAKAQVAHGQWLPWLRDHVEISERTAQVYMRCAKGREEIEKQIRSGAADLSLNEATAILALSSDIKRLFDFWTKRAPEMSPEELVQYCAENDVAMMTGNPFGAKELSEVDDTEWREWRCFVVFLVRHVGYSAEGAILHTEWLQSRGWRVILDCKEDEQWFGPWGDAYHKRIGAGGISQAIKDAWFAYYESNRHRTRRICSPRLASWNARSLNVPRGMSRPSFSSAAERRWQHERAPTPTKPTRVLILRLRVDEHEVHREHQPTPGRQRRRAIPR